MLAWDLYTTFQNIDIRNKKICLLFWFNIILFCGHKTQWFLSLTTRKHYLVFVYNNRRKHGIQLSLLMIRTDVKKVSFLSVWTQSDRTDNSLDAVAPDRHTFGNSCSGQTTGKGKRQEIEKKLTQWLIILLLFHNFLSIQNGMSTQIKAFGRCF